MLTPDTRLFIVGIVGLVFLLVLVPISAVYAIDYRVTESTLQSTSDDGVSTYEELGSESQSTVDSVRDGEGQWYRSRESAPAHLPLLYERNDAVYIVTLEERYHWSSWRGKVPIGALAIGLLCVAKATRDQVYNIIYTDEF
ncbi:hypothetical protein [Halopiger aswanensis]|uniref:Uncharacterized protein n=1 Tax=Halopiger aswanensis TaxID=148449 RepID=A0A419W1A5_9EURY|nr:hypothetical protein [Halopiger aswanensis]RKD89238.1 hypothetical protein ATJ93_4069 [Halopiger aswanensis]